MKLKPNDCLRTPFWVYGALGEISLDPCAGPDTTIGTVNYALEREEDGLVLAWGKGFVFCNPPLSQKELWIEKMLSHGNGILLLPERGSAPWFGPLALRTRKHFVMGKKINYEGGPSSNPLGSCLFPVGVEAYRRLLKCGLPGHMNSVEFFNPRPRG